MKFWLLMVQGDDATWLEGAWDDESTAESPEKYREDVDRVRKLAYDNNYEMRIIEAEIPGIFEAFEIPKTTGRIV